MTFILMTFFIYETIVIQREAVSLLLLYLGLKPHKLRSVVFILENAMTQTRPISFTELYSP